ncbi:hypothetical protein TNCV_4486601 [Trichonephila clavipes]|nr:hypothetical protein TNCV_4486601 [Trichonephila clavipes]
MKLCSAIHVNFPSKTAFRCLEKKLEHVSNKVACKIMNEAATKDHKKNKFDEVIQCDVSVDRTWQRRGHLFLNGYVSVISIDTAKYSETNTFRIPIPKTNIRPEFAAIAAKNLEARKPPLKPRKKKSFPKPICNEIEIKMTPHKPHKSLPIHNSLDEDMIEYEVDDYVLPEYWQKSHEEYLNTLTPTRHRNSKN